MVLSNKKYADIVRVVTRFVEDEEKRGICLKAIQEILQNEVDQYNRGLAKLNESNRVKREKKRAEELELRVQEYEQRRAMEQGRGTETPMETDSTSKSEIVVETPVETPVGA